ncbi:lipopolysaccharide biosynthesis protein [Mesorhizobium sp. J428]|uniref:lipopolysaccharide biosynthesis protein n=1 Tax=Mesorhizobium sp. J428 TaxID=2898440 RepID=UPI0021511163|nr:lipopolysaccharide biosynthesis protein [Mesorhizobium sp. J428]MCR5858399.1 lipopolysaccharide biosynthesis protein [Mesorhizobium sp. J428]
MISAMLRGRIGVLRDYASAISGSAGRLVFSLIYFIALANTLTIAEFGLFATASAAGVMLSRILAFGYITALYRTATVRPALIGVFTAGFIFMALISLPVLGLASFTAHALFFGSQMALPVFLTVIAAEALLWRPVETVVIVNNGMGRFGRASILVILGTVLRAIAASAFAFMPVRDLPTWSLFYLAANAVSLLIAAGFFYPRCRLRLRPRVYLRRLPDSLYVAGAEILFYLQMEMDKLLVLALGGAQLAGIYAMIMRLVDLTAIPIRTFTMMLVQRMMRTPELLAKTIRRVGLEAAVFVASTAALAVLAVILHYFPTLLGRNVSEAAPLLGLALFVPGLRNLVEYQAELLFARGQTLLRAINLALLAGLKAVLLAVVLVQSLEVSQLVIVLNAVFALLYIASALLTYSAMRLPAKTV